MQDNNAKVLTIGICGGTASGKSSLVRSVLRNIAPVRASVLDMDSYYRDISDLTQDERSRVNYDHPDAIDIQLFIEDIAKFKSGSSVDKPEYDFVTHSRMTHRTEVAFAPILFVEGLHILSVPEIRLEFDRTYFLDIDRDLRLIRRLNRDISERGRSLENTIEQYLTSVRPMELRYIYPSKIWADFVVDQDMLESAIEDISSFVVRHTAQL